MKPLLVAWISAAMAFAAMDAVWLSQMHGRLYRPLIGEMLFGAVRVAPAIAFYAIYISGLVYFCVAPALDSGGAARAALRGALMALVAYGAYDLTNQATLKVWDWRLTVADLSWGMFASAAAAALSCAIAGRTP